MLKFFRIWMHFLGLLVAVQFFLAGYGALGTGSPSEAYELHIMGGRLIGLASLLAIVFAALARSGRLTGMAAIIFGLVALQSIIALVSVDGTVAGQSVFGLHAINGLIIMMMVGKTAVTAKRMLADRGEPADRSASEPASAT